MTQRTLSPLDRLLIDAQNALGTLAGKPLARRPNPAQATPEVELDAGERRDTRWAARPRACSIGTATSTGK